MFHPGWRSLALFAGRGGRGYGTLAAVGMARRWVRFAGLMTAIGPNWGTRAEASATAAAGVHPVLAAIGAARAGRPVLLQGERPLLVLMAETAGEAALREFPRDGAAVVLGGGRAAILLGRPASGDGPVAFCLPGGAVTVPVLRAVADPLLPSPPGFAAALGRPVPAGADAALALAKFSRLLPAALVAEIAAGTPAGAGVAVVEAAAVLGWQETMAGSLVRVAEARVPLAEAAEARLVAFRPEDGGIEHLALLIGAPEQAEAPLVRVHSECFTGDLLGSLRCDCGPQLHQAIRRMAAEGAGVLLYMAQEGRGIGLVNKLRAYALQDAGLDTLDANRALGWGADERSFVPAAVMLRALGVTRVRLLTNNPAKLAALTACGIEVVGRVSHAIAANGVNDSYLETKARRFGHLI